MNDFARTEKQIYDLSKLVGVNLTNAARIAAEKVIEMAAVVATEQTRPSTLYRPALTQDGDAWLAVYGDFPTGVVGCGDTPAAAMADFDAAWLKPAVVAKGPQV